jgi:5'-nucleotidase
MVPNPYGIAVPIVQAGAFYQYVGKLHLTVGPGGVTVNDYTLIPVDASVPAAPAIAPIVASLKQSIVATYGDMYRAIRYAWFPVPRDVSATSVKRDGPLGDLVTDAQRKRMRTDVAITARGLISESLVKGWITGDDVFRTVPYGYDPATGLDLSLATFTLTGADIVKGLEIGLAYIGINDDFFLYASNLKFDYDSRLPQYQRVILSSVKINGRAINPAGSYTVTTNYGLALLLPQMGISATNLVVSQTPEYRAVRDYIANDDNPLYYESQGRIRDLALVK